MATTHSTGVLEHPVSAGRSATVTVRGVPVTIPCPPWCVMDHAAEHSAFLEDVHHEGPEIRLPVPLYAGGTENVMVAHLSMWPFANGEDQGRTYLAIDPAGDGEVNGLYRGAALAFADQLAAHADEIRRVALLADEAPLDTSARGAVA